MHMSYALVLGHIQPLIYSLDTFIHQTFNLYMSYMRYWEIFNHWYIAYTLLYIRHTPCTCRMHFIGPYSTIDTQLIHFYTSDIHPAHVLYVVFRNIEPVIHSLFTFIHQTYTLYMSYTRVLGHIQPLIHELIHFYTSDIHPVHVVHTVLGNIQPLIHSLYTFIHQTYTLYMSYTLILGHIINHWYIAYTLLYIRYTPCTCRIHCIGPYSTIDT